jgi:hypothetical protein
MKFILVFLIGGIFIKPVFGQTPDYPPPTNLVSMPTAGTLNKGSYLFNLRIQNHGGLLAGMTVGVTDRFSFGVSYGADSLIGDNDVKWHPRPEANFKYRAVDETLLTPGVALGFISQGYGAYNADSLQRYDVKAYGLYAVASKNWRSLLGNIGIHGGFNYNFLETDDGDNDPNLFLGFDMDLNPDLSLMLEYNAALNENDKKAKSFSVNRDGYLNAGIRWTFAKRLHIELDFNSLLFNKEQVDYFNREIQITYIEYFK